MFLKRWQLLFVVVPFADFGTTLCCVIFDKKRFQKIVNCAIVIAIPNNLVEEYTFHDNPPGDGQTGRR